MGNSIGKASSAAPSAGSDLANSSSGVSALGPHHGMAEDGRWPYGARPLLSPEVEAEEPEASDLSPQAARRRGTV